VVTAFSLKIASGRLKIATDILPTPWPIDFTFGFGDRVFCGFTHFVQGKFVEPMANIWHSRW